jgi:hypothetical protein
MSAEDEVGMGFEWGIGSAGGELAGHAEVNDECGRVVESHEDALAAAVYLRDGAVVEGLGEVGVGGVEDVAAEEVDVRDHSADDMWAECSDDGFDFGEFGHGRMGWVKLLGGARILRRD